ncbi:MAG: nucleoside hydrolase [Alkalispirochaetaceae bacterium]
MATPVFIDCDPGHDDMMAIMLAASHPDLEVIGITTVAGNQTGAKTYNNAGRTLTLINRLDIPVVRGADAPLCRPLVTAPAIHGSSGLDGADLPDSRIPVIEESAPAFMARRIFERKERVVLVPTGPLTNVALALRTYPALGDKIERIVLMGGAVYDSNITPAAEFNIYVDPEAASTVFESGIPITMVGLDATNKAKMLYPEIEKLEKHSGPIHRIVGPLMRFFADTNREVFGFDGAPIHDALAVATVIEPGIITGDEYRVDIETSSELTRGQTVADLYRVTGKGANARVAMGVDRERLMQMLFEAIKRLEERL